MTLSDQQALDIISNRPNKRLITQGQKYTEKLLMHIKGVGIDKYIDRIEAFEKEDIIKIRKKYAVSNKAMFTRVNRPVDKVYSAKGGSVYYNLGEDASNRLKDYLSNLAEGYTIKQWLETFYMPATGYDPMGLIMMEMDAAGNPYPTYKSILDIFEYLPRNRNVEYIIFKLDPEGINLPVKSDPDRPVPQGDGDARLIQAVKEGDGSAAELYRVVDDMFDRIVKVKDGVLIDVGDTYPNYWGKVPASIISNIYDPVLSMFISTEDAIIELADQFLREGSVKNIIKNYHGFPRAWEYQSACPQCKGTKVLNGRPCDYCKGSGIKSQSFPEETIRIPVPQSTDQPKLAPDLGGYITPPIDGINLYTDELELLEDIIFETKWGTHQADDTKKGASETATGKFIDVQPVNDRLNKYSDAAEMMETFVTDRIGEILFGRGYKGASITYGRRFLIETPDEIWNKLQDARLKGAPTAALYDLYNDYLQARYSANAMEMQKMLKLAKIEPLPFVKYEEFGKLQSFPDVILRQKFWWEKWMNSKKDPEILYGDVLALQKDFAQFCVDQDAQLNEDVQKNTALNGGGTPVDPAAPSKSGTPAPLPGKKQKQAA